MSEPGDATSPPVRCPRCGAGLPSGTAPSECPRCALIAALAAVPASGSSPAAESMPSAGAGRLRFLGDYELVELIAEGGMGQVYRSRQLSTNRETALKILNPSAFGSPRAAQRFRNEIETVASLDHPHILPIFEAGEDGGIRFFSMRLAPGGSLAQALADGRWAPATGPRERARQADGARLVAAVARGVHHAHERGVIHRDLKPGNILLDAEGGPLVADFGLARAMHADASPSQTYEVLGTPAYMAPEQTRGGRLATVASDIYSLGVVLYELLTGRQPFAGGDWEELSRCIREEEPAPPSRWVPAIDRDLVTICLKCLAKEPPHRYRSAAELADDLERWLRHEPVTARPLHAGQRLARWVRRHRVVAVLVALMLGIAVLGLAAVLWQWRATVRANRDLEHQISVTQQTMADVQFRGGDAPQALQSLAQQVRRNPMDQASATRLWSALVRRTRAMPRRVMEIPSGAAEDFLWHPAGHQVAVISLSGFNLDRHELSIRDWRSGAIVAAPIPLGGQPGDLAYSPDGRRLLTTFDARFQVFDSSNLQSVASPALVGYAGLAFAWHPDSRRALLATGTNEAVLAPVVAGAEPSGDQVQRIPTQGQALAVALSRDGKFAAVGDALGHVRLRNLESGAALSEPPRFERAIAGLTFAPAGDRVIVMEAGGGVSLWSWPEARTVLHETNATIATFDVRGERLLLWANPGARVVDARGGKLLQEWPGCLPHYPDGFSPDGRWLVLLEGTKAVRWIDATTFADAAEPIANPRPVNALHLAPDGRSVGIALDRPEVEFWAVPWAVAPPDVVAQPVTRLWFSPGQDWVALAIGSGLELRRANAIEQTVHRIALPAPANAVAFAGPAGSVAASTGGEVGVWRVAEGTEVRRWPFPTNQVSFVALSPSGEWLVTLTADGRLDQWSVATGRQVMPTVDVAAGPKPFFGGGPPRDLAFSPRGDAFAVGCHNGDVLGFDAGTGRRRFALHHEIAVSALRFSLDGRWIAAADFLQSARVWDAVTGAAVSPPLAHPDMVSSLDFSPDGARLLTVELGGRARVWDAQRGTLLAACLSTNYGLVPVRFAPDGRRFAAGGAGMVVQIWDATTGLPQQEPLAVGPGRIELGWLPGGEQLLVRRSDGTVVRWGTTRLPEPVPAWVPELAVALSGAVTTPSPARPILAALAHGATNATGAPFWREAARAFVPP